MHKAQTDFLLNIKKNHPNYFSNIRVLDVGSCDVNGNNRFLFENCEYLGLDIVNGDNVDIVMPAHQYKTNDKFDVVISSECFEHDLYYKETILNCVDLLKNNGMFLFTCASTGRLEHGTERTTPWASPSCGIFNDYYKNLTEEDIRDIIDCDKIFYEYKFIYNPDGASIGEGDLYFYGIKK